MLSKIVCFFLKHEYVKLNYKRVCARCKKTQYLFLSRITGERSWRDSDDLAGEGEED